MEKRKIPKARSYTCRSCTQTFKFTGKGKLRVICPACKEKELEEKAHDLTISLKCNSCDDTFTHTKGKGKPPSKCKKCTVPYQPNQRNATCRHCGEPFTFVGRGKTRTTCDKCKENPPETVRFVSAVCRQCSNPFEYPSRKGSPATVCNTCKADGVGDDKKSLQLISHVLRTLEVDLQPEVVLGKIASEQRAETEETKKAKAEAVVDNLEMRLRMRGQHISQNRDQWYG